MGSVLVQNPLSKPNAEVRDVYFETPKRLSVLDSPVRLAPGGHWEMAVPAGSIPAASDDVRSLVKVELSDATIIRSKPGRDVEPHPDFVFDPGRPVGEEAS